MAGKWDSTLKQLVKINPQHFISWTLEIARLAIDKTEAIADEKKLQDLIVYMSIAQTEADARQYFLDIDKQETNG